MARVTSPAVQIPDVGRSIVIRHGAREIKRLLLDAADRGDLVEVYVGQRALAPICECGRAALEGAPDG
jgi:hypothetical protein